MNFIAGSAQSTVDIFTLDAAVPNLVAGQIFAAAGGAAFILLVGWCFTFGRTVTPRVYSRVVTVTAIASAAICLIGLSYVSLQTDARDRSVQSAMTDHGITGLDAPSTQFFMAGKTMRAKQNGTPVLVRLTETDPGVFRVEVRRDIER